MSTPAVATDMVTMCYLRETIGSNIDPGTGNVATTGDYRLLVMRFPVQLGRNETPSAKYHDPTNMMLGRPIEAVRVDAKAIGVETKGLPDDAITIAMSPPVGPKMISTAFLMHGGKSVKAPTSYVGSCKPLVVSNPDEAYSSFLTQPPTRKP